jgi:hypothetical protein
MIGDEVEVDVGCAQPVTRALKLRLATGDKSCVREKMQILPQFGSVEKAVIRGLGVQLAVISAGLMVSGPESGRRNHSGVGRAEHRGGKDYQIAAVVLGFLKLRPCAFDLLSHRLSGGEPFFFRK